MLHAIAASAVAGRVQLGVLSWVNGCGHAAGGELFERIIQRGTFSEAEAARYFRQMVEVRWQHAWQAEAAAAAAAAAVIAAATAAVAALKGSYLLASLPPACAPPVVPPF
jgi:hypothetical protein